MAAHETHLELGVLGHGGSPGPGAELAHAEDAYDDGVLTLDPRVNPDRTLPLDAIDVFSLVVNRMIGSGIYTFPALTYRESGNKRLALGLWGLGFVYTIVR